MKLFGRIGTRLLGYFFLVALVPLIFMGYEGYHFARRAVEREVYAHMETVAQAKRQAIEQWFRERQHDMQVLAANPLLRATRSDTAAIRELLLSMQRQSPSYAVISVVVSGTRITVPEGARYTVPALEDTASAMSRIYLHARFGPAINLQQPITESSGRMRGLASAILTLTQTLNPIILDTSGLGATGQAYLVDEDKVMLTPSRFMNHPHPLTHRMDSEGIRKALAGTNGAGVYEGFDGQPVMGAWAFMPQQKWGLIAEINADEAFAPLATLRRYTILVALAALGAILIVVVLISRSISRPIRQLAEASLDVSRGNWERTVAVQSRDEVGELAERFNSMVHSLRESQRQLVQSERLAAIGELVASVVHEIRNPLSAVKMNLRILETKCATDPVVAEHFKLARTQTERLEIMLAELLDYSKPIGLHKQPVPVADLLRDALQNFESAREKGIQVTTRLAEPLPVPSIDKERILQVLLNLLLNAQQATGAHGKIEIEVGQIQNAAALCIRVHDNGSGISEENLQHIFEPFFTTRKTGTGLGLPNARKIIEAHGGTLTVRSTSHKGTDAEITLPVA